MATRSTTPTKQNMKPLLECPGAPLRKKSSEHLSVQSIPFTGEFTDPKDGMNTPKKASGFAPTLEEIGKKIKFETDMECPGAPRKKSRTMMDRPPFVE
jgi:hypothetical protein